ncbi:MAG: methyltransferase domain-containing protein [Hyphomonadaceae bacterium]
MSVGHEIDADNASWTFGGKVAETFVEHIRQSVPMYEEGHDLTCQLSDYFVSNGSTCYELGVSTGELLKKLAERNAAKPGARWIGIDTERPMIDQAKKHCKGIKNIELVEDDIRVFEFEPADLMVSYYTMQFTPPRDRQAIFDKIYESLNWGGAFIMFEKVRGPDARFQDICSSLYNDFKTEQGFSAEEILSKTRSLKGVLEPFSTEGNIGLLERAGFSDVMTISKYICFEGFLAIK